MNDWTYNIAELEVYANIQKYLRDLNEESTDEQIEDLFKIVPTDYLNSKERLLMLCQIFAKVSRNHRKMDRIIYKLFEHILEDIKRNLSDESIEFWEIFYGVFHFKLWLYEQGLISIDTIVMKAQKDQSSETAQYFLPEIIEKKPEFFYKDIKFRFPHFSHEESYSEQTISNLKSLRLKHREWVKTSNDYYDTIFEQIETDRLKYAIKTNDIDSFQKLISANNISLTSKVKQSIIDHHFRPGYEFSFLELATYCDSIDIIKFLLMKEPDIEESMIQASVCSGNYEMFHLAESKLEEFAAHAMKVAISFWDIEIIDYLLENYQYPFHDTVLLIGEAADEDEFASYISAAIYSFNVEFLCTIAFPILRFYSDFAKRHANTIFYNSLSDISGFFSRQLIALPGFDKNYVNYDEDRNFLAEAVCCNNLKAVKLLLQLPNINVNAFGSCQHTPYMLGCWYFSDIKIINELCQDPRTYIHCHDHNHVPVFPVTVIKGNVYAIDYLEKKFPDLAYDYADKGLVAFHCINSKTLLTLKHYIYFLLNQCESNERIQEIINRINASITNLSNDNAQFSTTFQSIANEVLAECGKKFNNDTKATSNTIQCSK